MKKIVNLRLPLFIALSMVCGILSTGFFTVQKYFYAITFLVVFLAFASLYFISGIKGKNISKTLTICLVLILSATVGVFGTLLQFNAYKNADLGGGTYTVCGRVDNVLLSQEQTRIIIKNVKFSGKITKSTSYKMAVYLDANTKDFRLGDEITFTSNVHDYGLIYDGRISSNNLRSGIKYNTNVDCESVTILSHNPTLFDQVNLFIKNTLKNAMGEGEFAFSYALLVGNDDFMDDGVITQFRQAGVAHIFAVSGLHIGFLAGVISFVLRKLKTNRWFNLIFTIFILIIYSGVCGFSASSVRATVMCGVMLLITNLGMRYDGLSALGLAGFLVLLLSPVEAFCAGFQLSFIVVFGILVLSPKLKKLFEFMPEKLASNLATVISAQVFSIPVSLWCFGQFSVVSVLLNLFFIPVTCVLYVLTLVGVVLGGLLSIAPITLFISKYLIKLVVAIITFFDYGPFMISGFSFGFFAITYFGALLVLSGFFNLYKRVKSWLLIGLLSVTFLGCITQTVVDKYKTDVYVVGTSSFCFSVVDCSGFTTVVVNDASGNLPRSKLQKIILQENIDKIDALVLTDGSQTVDINTLVSKFYHTVSIDKVYYYGSARVEQEIALYLSFPNVKTKNISADQSFVLAKATCRFALDGNVLDVELNGKNIAFFNKMGENPRYKGLAKRYDAIVVCDYAEQIFSCYQPKRKISYLSSQDYKNAQDYGTLKNPV